MTIGMFTDAHYAEGLTVGSRACSASAGKVARILEGLAGCDIAVNIGDLINATGDAARDAANLKTMKRIIDNSPVEVISVVGNHDVEVFDRAEFTGREEGYYRVDLGELALIVLDANYSSDSLDYRGREFNWEDSYIPPAQIGWLEEQLRSAPGGAVVFCHQNLDERKLEGGAMDPHVIKNARQVRRLMEGSGAVRAVFQGHYHAGCRQVIGGIPYYTLNATCEGSDIPYIIADVRPETVSVRGFGAPSAVYEARWGRW